MAENMTKKMKFDYDQGADVLYVSLGTGEPSFSEEIDDHVVVDFGMYTGAPTGFQILHIKDADVHSVQVLLQKTFAKLTIRKKQSLEAMISQRERLMKTAIESFPRRVGDLISTA